MNTYIEQTSGKKLPVIFGEKVVLVPFFDVLDMDSFIDLHRKDRKGYMCRFSMKNLRQEEAEEYLHNLIDSNSLYIWNVCPKNNERQRAGFIYLSNVNQGHSASINGIMDKSFAKSLSKEERKDRLTYADDAAIALIKTCFEGGFERIEGDAVEDDREAIAMHKRLGFKQEGILRKAVNVDGEFKNLVVVSILKDEFTKEDTHG